MDGMAGPTEFGSPRRSVGGGASAGAGPPTAVLSSSPTISSAGSTRRCWKQIQYHGTPPGPRSGAASVVQGNKLYMFGGYGGNGRLDDFFEYDFDTRTWTSVEYASGASPGVRENNGVVVQGRCLYLFGGYNGSQWLNDFHEFNLDTRTWRLVEPKGNCPASRFGYVSVTYKKKFILFGGYDGTTWLNDMFEFDFTTWTWNPMQVTGSVPSIRSCPSWARRGNSVYVFGGYDGVQRMNDFYEFRLDLNLWTAVPATGNAPSPRYFHSCAVYGNCVCQSSFPDTFGGYNGSERLNDMHEFSFETHRWSLIDTTGDVPSGRSSLVAQVYGNSLYVFGGYNGHVVLNDFYEFRFEPVVIPPPMLIDDLKRLIDNPEFSDVVFEVEGREVHAVRAHLAVRSEHFRALLYGGMRESQLIKQAGDAAIKPAPISIPEVSHAVFLKMLEFLYTDTVTEIDHEVAVPLLIAAERYLLDRLKGLCEDAIRKSIACDNVVSIFIAAHRHNADGLKGICLEFIIDNFFAVKQSKAFQELKAEPELLMEIVMQHS